MNNTSTEKESTENMWNGEVDLSKVRNKRNMPKKQTIHSENVIGRCKSNEVGKMPVNKAPSEKRNNAIVEYGEFDDDVFVTKDLVWAKLKGWPVWPAKVSFYG